MNIAFLIQSLESGGAERQLALLAQGLFDNGHTVTVIILRGGGRYESELQNAGVIVQSLEKQGRWDLIGPIRRLAKILFGLEPDILHGYMPVANVLARLVGSITPCKRVVFGVRASNMGLDQYDFVARWSYRIERFLARWADLIITNSDAGAAIYRGLSSNSPVGVVPNGIDTERFCVMPTSDLNLRKDLGINQHDRVVGLVARLDPMKDIETFLNAIAILHRDEPNLQFLIVGDGPAAYKQHLLDLAASLGLTDRIVWRAYQSDMTAIYNLCDVTALSSAFGEGFPNTVAEAMACGVRCVVTDVGDAAAIVGETGLVVPPRQPEAMATAISELLEGSNTASLPDPRARILSEYYVDAMVNRTESALAALLP